MHYIHNYHLLKHQRLWFYLAGRTGWQGIITKLFTIVLRCDDALDRNLHRI